MNVRFHIYSIVLTECAGVLALAIARMSYFRQAFGVQAHTVNGYKVIDHSGAIEGFNARLAC